MTRPTQSATIELLRRPTADGKTYRVIKTKNTLEIKPGELLNEREVKSIISGRKIDLSIVGEKDRR